MAKIIKKSRKILKPRQPRQKYNPDSFDIGKFESVNLKAGSVRFSSFYGRRPIQFRYAIAVLIGVITGISAQFLIKNTGLYNSGVAAIAQGIARLTNTALIKGEVNEDVVKLVFNLLFWGLYVVVNIPLFIFGYKKIGKTFTFLTIVFVVSNSATGFALSYIPGCDNVFVFGNTLAEGIHGWEGFKPESPLDPNGIPYYNYAYHGENVLVANKIYIIPFDFSPHGDTMTLGHSKGSYYDLEQVFNESYDPYKGILLLIYAVIYGIANAFACALLYIIGACASGSDFISIYYSSKKNKSLGSFMIIVNSSMMVVGFIIGSNISAGMIIPQAYHFYFFVSANLVGSFLTILVFGVLLNRLFPLQRMVRVEINSEHITNIRDHLYKENFTHSMSITKTVGAYSAREHDLLWTVCMQIEMPTLIRQIRKVDPDALIIVYPVASVDGKMRVYRQGSTE